MGSPTSEPLHQALWRENRDLARACEEHPFVVGLRDGTLPREAFRGYVAQDAFFLRAFFRAYAVAAARCADRLQVAATLTRLMGGVLDEIRLHEGYAASLGIDLDEVRPHGATSAYTDFLLRTAWTADAAEILAAMTPCMRLYAHLGQTLARSGDHARNPYRDWIETYASDEFEALAADLEGMLDRLADPDGSAVADAYRYAMRCEVDFFSASLAT